AVAVALVGSPELLFLDEPTTGLDPGARIRIWNAVESFVREKNTVVLTTHYMEEASRLCQRVGIIDEGSLQALDTPSKLLEMLDAREIVEVTVEGEAPSALLSRTPGVVRTEKRGGTAMLFTNEPAAVIPRVLASLAEESIPVRLLVTRQATLEDVFLHLTGKKLLEAGDTNAAKNTETE
ncbi:MAG: AAA family ATPase, partial [Thermodesulfobacteriota bacterium]